MDDGATPRCAARPAPAAPAAEADDLASWPTGRLLSTAARLVEHAWAQRLERQGLTHAGLVALHVLAEGALPQRELASRCAVTEQTMSRTLDRLGRAGLVTRERDAADGRRVLVRRTREGDRAHARAVDLSLTERELLGDGIDVAALRAALVTIVERLGDRPGVP